MPETTGNDRDELGLIRAISVKVSALHYFFSSVSLFSGAFVISTKGYV